MAPPTQHPLYPLLEVEYDDEHRAHMLTDTDAEVALPPLRPHTHSRAHEWDECYTPYICHAGFLELVRIVNYDLPALDPALLTVAVDRWRPETHTLHLPCGEMTMTMQDVKAIFGLWKTSGVSSSWITELFDNLHPQADEAEIDKFARVWLWHFLGVFLFPNALGTTIS
ncbi:serine/threonine-protein phosphatase 7 long form homolog [Miscanthus floridulus]|uniref:serine/threonine-protein phosphatase 7 long form homolog n=1 Tax=Miscanthus floridulus TaxID=154761 RepID=UPI003459C319